MSHDTPQDKNTRQLSSAELKQYRAIAHKLTPVVTVANNGLSERVLAEVNRALNDHELVKIKISVADRILRNKTIEELCQHATAVLIQRIGKTATLLRRNPTAAPKKSNLQRLF